VNDQIPSLTRDLPGLARSIVAVLAIAILATIAGGCANSGTGTHEKPVDAREGERGEPGASAVTSSRAANKINLPRSRQLAAREEGRRACRGLTALQVAKRNERAAVKAGVRPNFANSAVKPVSGTEDSPAYARLVASLYATTLPPVDRPSAAMGCVEELASPSGGN
jgi:hypothetical protein